MVLALDFVLLRFVAAFVGALRILGITWVSEVLVLFSALFSVALCRDPDNLGCFALLAFSFHLFCDEISLARVFVCVSMLTWSIPGAEKRLPRNQKYPSIRLTSIAIS